MLAPKRPTSVYDHKPVAVMVVKQQKSGAVDKHVLVVENKPAPASDQLPAAPSPK
jgi:hypothetical protein